MKKTSNHILLTATILSLLSTQSQAESASQIDEALNPILEFGTPYIDMRYRFENIDQTGLVNEANASTLRTNLGFKTNKFHDFSGSIEIQQISRIFSGDYNDTVNGKTTYPIVADANITELNELFLEYSGVEETNFKLGRQRINLDNQRFIGSVGWRQNDQTMDSFNITNTSIPDTTLFLDYTNKVHRVFGDDSAVGNFEGDVFMLNVQNKSLPEIGIITGYMYSLDFDDSLANSSRTVGASLDGMKPINDSLNFKYYAEYATQSDFGGNTTNYDANYYHLAPALVYGDLTTTLGYEVLGSDNGIAGFQTPLATLHAFNGWADKFLTTPTTGLRDIYLDITYKIAGLDGDLSPLNGVLLKGQYHDFSADSGGADYGDEYGVYVKVPICENIYAEAKYANYNADSFATDTQKITFGIGAKF